jgi:O-antigen ligase
LTAAFAVAVGLVLWFVFRRLERTDRSTTVVAIVWGLLLLDTCLYPNESTVPTGLIHPAIGGLSFRLLDVVVLVALAARLTTSGIPRFGPRGLLWGAFLAWIATAGVVGFLNGNATDQLTFEGKELLYLGAMLLTAGIPASRYLESGFLTKLIVATSALATLLLITSTAGITFSLGSQAAPASAGATGTADTTYLAAGTLGTDTTTIFVALGIVALALGLNASRPRQRFVLMLASAPLLASTLGSTQRAAFVGLGVSLAVLIVLCAISRQRLKAKPVELGLAGLAVIALVVGPTVLKTISNEKPAAVPFSSQVETGFVSRGKQLSTQDRLNQWQMAKRLIEARPVFGWGLGKIYSYFEPGSMEFVQLDITHNIGLDILVRTGAAGLLLFVAALATSLFGALRTWYRSREELIAALALGVTAAVLGLLGKGMAESILEKYRIAVALGLFLGILLSAATAGEQLREATQPKEELLDLRPAPVPA